MDFQSNYCLWALFYSLQAQKIERAPDDENGTLMYFLRLHRETCQVLSTCFCKRTCCFHQAYSPPQTPGSLWNHHLIRGRGSRGQLGAGVRQGSLVGPENRAQDTQTEVRHTMGMQGEGEGAAEREETEPAR